jgi:hypothetical protein
VDHRETGRKTARRVITVVISMAVILTLLAVWSSARDPWWHVIGFGCPQGYFRIDGGRDRVQGACGGLSPTGIALKLKQGQTIDVHLFGFSAVKTSDPTVVASFTTLFDSSSQHFRAVSPGHAVLSTETQHWLCGGPNTDPPSAAALASKTCPVFVVTVSR